MPWYSAGTVAVTNNSPTVTGSGTSFSANARVGDAFRGPDGFWYEVTNVASATVISIKPNYQSASNAAGSYAVAPMQGYVKDSADALRGFVNQYGALLASLGPVASWQPGNPFVLAGVGVRFQADMANATHGNRFMFQGSTVNGASFIGVVPNGSSNVAGMHIYNSSDTGNCGIGQFAITSSAVQLLSGINGSGANLPIDVFVGGAQRVRFHAGGTVLVGGITSDAGLGLGTAGSAGSGIAGGYYVSQSSASGINVQLSKPVGFAQNAFQSFAVNGSIIGSITTTGTSTAYNTTSDRRLKENIEASDLEAAYESLDGYNLYSLNYKADPATVIPYSWVADDLQAHDPLMVTGEPGAEVEVGDLFEVVHSSQEGSGASADGEEPIENLIAQGVEQQSGPGLRWVRTGRRAAYQMVDNSKGVPRLYAVAKVMKARIEGLESENGQLRSMLEDVLRRLDALEQPAA